MEKGTAIDWSNINREALEKKGGEILKSSNASCRRYYLVRASISVGIHANIGGYDDNALIEFGPFKIPFSKIRKLLLQGKSEFELPNGEIAMIPNSWFVNYSEIFSFLE